MILDDKLINLCDVICKQFDTEEFLFVYDSDKVIIKTINRGRFSILHLEINKNELTDYPNYPSIYSLDVKPRSFMLENEPELILSSYAHCDDDHLINLVCSFEIYMRRCEGYVQYPFKEFEYIMTKLKERFPTENMRLEFRYNKFNSVYSVNSLEKLLFGENAECIRFKLIGSDMPLYLNYNTVLDDLNINVYGVHAPLIEVIADDWIRVV